MPMLSTGLTNDDISSMNLPWLPTSVTDPTRTHLHFQDLTALMGVPVCAGCWREEDVVEHNLGRVGGGSVGVREDGRMGLPYVAFGPGLVVEIESMYTVPVNVPVATREDGESDKDEAVEFGMMLEGIAPV